MLVLFLQAGGQHLLHKKKYISLMAPGHLCEEQPGGNAAPAPVQNNDVDIIQDTKFKQVYWLLFKYYLQFFNQFSIVVALMLCSFGTYLYFVIPTNNRSEVYQMRNLSALVPIWGRKDGELFINKLLALDFFGGAVLYFTITVLGSITYSSVKNNDSNDTGVIVRNLCLYIFVNLVTMAASSHLFFSIYEYNSPWSMADRRDLRIHFHKHYQVLGENSFSTRMNLMMISSKCCGVNGPDDFSYFNLTLELKAHVHDTYMYGPENPHFYWPRGGFVANVKVPPVCCKDIFFKGGTMEDQFKRQINCAKKGYDTEHINTVGCHYFNFYSFSKYPKLKIVFIVLFAVTVHLKCMCTILCLLRLLQHYDSFTTEVKDIGQSETPSRGDFHSPKN